MSWLWVYVAMAAVAAMIPFYANLNMHGSKAKALTVKGMCTLIAVLLGLNGAVRSGGAAWWLFAGLCVCMAADVVIGVYFPAGGVLFFIAHIIYVAAFVQIGYSLTSSLVVFILMVCLLIFLFKKWWPMFKDKPYVPCVVYALMLCVMASFGVPQLWLLDLPRGLLLCLGAALFVLSDGILCRNHLLGQTKRRDMSNLYVYYAAQILIGAAYLF